MVVNYSVLGKLAKAHLITKNVASICNEVGNIEVFRVFKQASSGILENLGYSRMSKMSAQAWQIAHRTSRRRRGRRRSPSGVVAGNQVGLCRAPDSSLGTRIALMSLNGFSQRNGFPEEELVMAYPDLTVPFIKVVTPIWSLRLFTSWRALPSPPASCFPFCQQHGVIFQPGLTPMCPHWHCHWHPHSEGWQQRLGRKQGPFQVILNPLRPRAVYAAVLVKV